MSTISNLKTQPGATALLIVTLFVFLGILLFGLAVVITKKRKRGRISIMSDDGELEYSKLMSRNNDEYCE